MKMGSITNRKCPLYLATVSSWNSIMFSLKSERRIYGQRFGKRCRCCHWFGGKCVFIGNDFFFVLCYSCSLFFHSCNAETPMCCGFICHLVVCELPRWLPSRISDTTYLKADERESSTFFFVFSRLDVELPQAIPSDGVFVVLFTSNSRYCLGEVQVCGREFRRRAACHPHLSIKRFIRL